MATVIDIAKDEEIISAYNRSSNYTEMARLLGYKNTISLAVRNQLRVRMQRIGLPLFVAGKNIREYTKGELISHRKNYQSFRSDIRSDACRVYENSTKPKHCLICGYSKHYEVCHIKAVSDFDKDTPITVINHIDNLVALCPNHHWEFDNGLLNIAEWRSGSLSAS